MKKFLSLFLILIVTLSFSAFAQTIYQEGDKVMTTGSVNVRTSYSLAADRITSVKKGTAGTVKNAKYDERGVIWYKLKIDTGITGWVSEKYLTKYEEPVPFIPEFKEASGKRVVTGSLTVRNYPALSGKRVDILKKGTVVKVYGKAKDARGVWWFAIDDGGDTIRTHKKWVSSKYLTSYTKPVSPWEESDLEY